MSEITSANNELNMLDSFEQELTAQLTNFGHFSTHLDDIQTKSDNLIKSFEDLGEKVGTNVETLERVKQTLEDLEKNLPIDIPKQVEEQIKGLKGAIEAQIAELKTQVGVFKELNADIIGNQQIIITNTGNITNALTTFATKTDVNFEKQKQLSDAISAALTTFAERTDGNFEIQRQISDAISNVLRTFAERTDGNFEKQKRLSNAISNALTKFEEKTDGNFETLKQLLIVLLITNILSVILLAVAIYLKWL